MMLKFSFLILILILTRSIKIVFIIYKIHHFLVTILIILDAILLKNIIF